MQYWRGGKQTTKETPQPPSPFEFATGFVKARPEPERKSRLEQELVLISMKLGLGLLVLIPRFSDYHFLISLLDLLALDESSNCV